MSFPSPKSPPDTESPISPTLSDSDSFEIVPETEFQGDLPPCVAYVSDSPSDDESHGRGLIHSALKSKVAAARRRRQEDRAARAEATAEERFMLDAAAERERMRQILRESPALKEIHQIFLPRLFEKTPNSPTAWRFALKMNSTSPQQPSSSRTPASRSSTPRAETE